jgi:hypothetical protein
MPVGEWELALPNSEDMKNRFKKEERHPTRHHLLRAHTGMADLDICAEKS